MQARLQFTRFPVLLFSVIFALAAALVLGGVLGYVLKPTTIVPGRTQVLVVHDSAGTNRGADGCIWIGGHKACD